MSKDISDIEFEKCFPDEKTCLLFLYNKFYKDKSCPKCGEHTKFYPVTKRRCFECGKCGYQVFPANHTVARNSKVPIKKWLKAIYFMGQNKNAVSSMEIGRHLKVSYKTALNMVHKIQFQFNEPFEFKLDGAIEVDETWIGGKRGQKYRKRKKNEEARADEEIAKAISPEKEPEPKKKSVRNAVGFNGQENKTMVFGILQRFGLVKSFIPDGKGCDALLPLIVSHVDQDSIIYSDEYAVYEKLPQLGFNHRVVHHTKYRWAYGKISTNGIEGYWSRIKNSIRGGPKHLSKKYLPLYLFKFDFIYNRRKFGTRCVFDDMVHRFLYPEVLLKKHSSKRISKRLIDSSGP